MFWGWSILPATNSRFYLYAYRCLSSGCVLNYWSEVCPENIQNSNHGRVHLYRCHVSVRRRKGRVSLYCFSFVFNRNNYYNPYVTVKLDFVTSLNHIFSIISEWSPILFMFRERNYDLVPSNLSVHDHNGREQKGNRPRRLRIDQMKEIDLDYLIDYKVHGDTQTIHSLLI